jgi:transcriptional regulator with PAS, ATPase and Fis domain
VSSPSKRESVVDETLTDSISRASSEQADVVAPHIFVALECDRLAAGVARHSLANIDRVVLGRGSARSFERSLEAGVRTLTLRVPDARASHRHALVVRDGRDMVVPDSGSRKGTRVNGARIAAPTPLSDGDVVQMGHTLLRFRAAVASPLGEPADLDSSSKSGETALATIDPSLDRRAALLARVARSTDPVMVLGETGTGKEVLARAIHRISRRGGPFVAVNCAALPASLVEGQLFGHVRGAFSGAVAGALGFLRDADGGTLLLDEIGDLPAAAQPALLRALQEREVVPVGATRPVSVDLRVICATHRPLEQLVAQGAFRVDLYARLAAFTFCIPPLRARREDLGLLIASFERSASIRLTPEAGHALLSYAWPLNVRELRNVLNVAANLAERSVIDVADLPAPLRGGATPAGSSEVMRVASDPRRERLLASLARHNGNVSEVAREMGKARTQIQRWLRRFGIEASSFRES